MPSLAKWQLENIFSAIDADESGKTWFDVPN